MRVPRLSGPARIALWLWVVSLTVSAAIMLVAASKARAAGRMLEIVEPVTVTLHPTGRLMLGVVGLSALALILSVLAIVVAALSSRPRGGI